MMIKRMKTIKQYIQYKKQLALVLLLVFVLPFVIQYGDLAFHHHDNFACTAKHEKHIHVQHDTCSIASFTFTPFVSNTSLLFVLLKPAAFNKNSACYNSAYYTQLKHTFQLRAPPFVNYLV